MHPLEALSHYCYAGTAEGEEAWLGDAFVVPKRYVDLTVPERGLPRLVIGRKGSGKTALFEVFKGQLNAAGVPSLVMRPDDLDLSPSEGVSDLAGVKRIAFDALVAKVGATIGSSMKGLLSEQNAILYTEAQKAGLSRPDLVQRLLLVIGAVGAATKDVDVGRLVPPRVKNANKLAEVISARLTDQGTTFYLLIDDTDQISSPEDRHYLLRIWGLLLAVRKLTKDCPNVRALVSLRSEVWARLQWGGTERDQVDHFRPLALELSPSDDEISLMLSRRLRLAESEAGVARGAGAYDNFFEGEFVRLPSSNESRPWGTFFVTSARGRPRDAIQFIGALCRHALEGRVDRISPTHVDVCAPEYSEQRKEYMCNEFREDCPQLDSIVRSFAGDAFEREAQNLMEFLLKLPSFFSINLRGSVLRPGNRTDAFRLWALLYEAGFISARTHDSREPDGYRHIHFRDEAGLITAANWPQLQRYAWEIHPAFRSYLIQVHKSERARLGLAVD